MIKSGLHDVVVVLGFQKMSEITSAESQERMGRGADIQWEAPFGTMMPAYYALYAQAYMAKHGLTHDDLMGSGSSRPPMARSTTGRSTGNRSKPKTLNRVIRKQKWQVRWHGHSGWAIAAPMRTEVLCHSCKRGKGETSVQEARLGSGIGAASEAVNMAARPDFSKGLSVGYAAAAQAYKMAGSPQKTSRSPKFTTASPSQRSWRMRGLDSR